MKKISFIASCFLIFSMLLSLCGCNRTNLPGKEPMDSEIITTPAENLTDGLIAADIPEYVNEYSQQQMNFSIELFKACTAQTDENLLISPASIYSVLGMTANGASDETLDQFKNILCDNSELLGYNAYMRGFLSRQSKLKLSNSLWIDSKKNIQKSFLQSCVDYYDAEVFSIQFGNDTKNTINSWINHKTDGAIKDIACNFDDNDSLMLLNTALFDANWAEQYYENEISDGSFTSASGEIRTAQMMKKLDRGYIKGKNVQGFVKDLDSTKYGFAVLLPANNVNIKDYIASLQLNTIYDLLNNIEEDTFVITTMPKFAYSSNISVDAALKEMGLTDAFMMDSANFGNMTDDELYIRQLSHKTVIDLNEYGIKCAAVTPEWLSTRGDYISDIEITLDRPFIYIIYEKDSLLPVFMGTVMDIGE